MLDREGLALNTIVLIGERTTSSSIGSIVSWSKTYSGSSETPSSLIKQYTEGQYRALYLRIRRLMMKEDFNYNKVYNIGDEEDLIIIENQLSDRVLLVAVLLRNEHYRFTPPLIEIINNVAARSGIYSAKKLHSEIFEALDHYQSDTHEEKTIVKFSHIEALVYLETMDLSNTSKELIAILLNSLISDEKSGDRKYLHSKQVYEGVAFMLSEIRDEDDPDIFLDAAYLIASAYKEATQFFYAKKTFERIAILAKKFERLSLEISCRIQISDILRIQDDDPSEILETLISIDDGSLEVASAYDREVYYCLHGFAYDRLDDDISAEDYYLMATMIAEMEGPNSIYVAEAHAYIARRHLSRYEIDNAIREYITAFSIAVANKQDDVATVYEHEAGRAELLWSDMLGASSVVLKMEGNILDAEYHAWKALKHLIKGIMYTSRDLRKNELDDYYLKVLKMAEEVLVQTYDEYTINTLNEIRENFKVLKEASLPEIQETELLKFLMTKVSVKLPLPNPIIMIIATDGRLITGGEIGSENWGSALGDNDDLFSGALSAIMAILSEVISSSNPLRMVDAGNTSIMIEKSDSCIGALLIDRDDIILRRALRDTLMKIEIKYPGLKEWDGYSIDFSDLQPLISKRFKDAMKELE